MHATSSASGTVTVESGATLMLASTTGGEIERNITLNGGTLSDNGTGSGIVLNSNISVAANSTISYNLAGSTMSLLGNISGTGNLLVVAGTNLTSTESAIALFGNNSSYTGDWTVDGGTGSAKLRFQPISDAAFGAVPTSFVANAITLQDGAILLNQTGAVTISPNRGITLVTLSGGGGTIRGGFTSNLEIDSLITGANLNIGGDSGAVVFGVNQTALSGTTTLAATNSKLILGNGTTAGLIATDVSGSGILAFNMPGSVTYANNVISGKRLDPPAGRRHRHAHRQQLLHRVRLHHRRRPQRQLDRRQHEQQPRRRQRQWRGRQHRRRHAPLHRPDRRQHLSAISPKIRLSAARSTSPTTPATAASTGPPAAARAAMSSRPAPAL